MSAAGALAVIELTRRLPPTAETIVFFLDDRHRGVGTIVAVSDTIDPDDVLGVVEMLCRAATERIADGTISGIVVASCRPRQALLPDDDERWLDLCLLVESFGLTLVEWFVLGPTGPVLPREMGGEPERWGAW